jgi:hypothetical protein
MRAKAPQPSWVNPEFDMDPWFGDSLLHGALHGTNFLPRSTVSVSSILVKLATWSKPRLFLR